MSIFMATPFSKQNSEQSLFEELSQNFCKSRQHFVGNILFLSLCNNSCSWYRLFLSKTCDNYLLKSIFLRFTRKENRFVW